MYVYNLINILYYFIKYTEHIIEAEDSGVSHSGETLRFKCVFLIIIFFNLVSDYD